MTQAYQQFQTYKCENPDHVGLDLYEALFEDHINFNPGTKQTQTTQLPKNLNTHVC